MSTPAYTLTNDSVTVIIDGTTLTVRRGAPNFDDARHAVLEDRWADIAFIMAPGHAVSRWLGDGFTFNEGVIWFDGEPVDSRLSDRMIKMMSKDENPAALMKFWRRLQNNPSMRSVEQLYGFLENKGIPLDAEGYILAYKSINSDYKDHHTGKCDNTVGQVLSMPRNRISDDPNQACHYGYHVGALEYASTFGGSGSRIVICRVDPADVVCVPYDHSMQKVRVCRYEVMSEQERPDFMSDTYEEVEPEYDDYCDDYGDGDYGDSAEDYDDDDAGDEEGGDGWVEEETIDFTTMNPADMHDCPLADLRAVAKTLGIKRVNNIIGGKAALIALIFKAQGR
jgi:hypothetical protein